MDTEAKYTELYETMKALLSNPHPDYDEVKMTAGGFLSIHKSFPSDLRFKIWEVLLDVSERTEPDYEQITKAQARFSNDHTLKLDVERSFNTVEEPQKSVLRGQLTTIIATYCAKYDVAYWQGMHDMVAVMLQMDPQPPMDRIFLLFSMFLQTFLPYVFDDRDCIFLKHLFEMIRLLLQYHDPKLALHLQQQHIIPAIYSPSWLLTLFSHDISQSLLLTIWDQYIFYKNPTTHVFTILAHLIANKARILSYPPSELLQLMTHLHFENDETAVSFEENDDGIVQVEHPQECDGTIITDIVLEGIRLMQRTPPGFVHRLTDIMNDRVAVSLESLEAYAETPCVESTPLEVFTYLLRGVDRNTNCLHYLILDTRSYESFRRRHLIQSRNVSRKTLLNLEKMDFLVKKSRSHECHIVVLDNGSELRSEGDVCRDLIDTLLRRGCRYISKVVGGFDRIVRLIEADDSLVVSDYVEEEKEVLEEGEESWEPKTKEKEKEKMPMVKEMDGKKCLFYSTWLANPHVKAFTCKRITKTTVEDEEKFVSSSEKKMVLTKSFVFVIDIAGCSEKDYAFIDNQFNYASIELVKATGKDYIYIVVSPKKEGQKKKLLYYVSQRDECLSELQSHCNSPSLS